jgi:hypothetical protein
METKTQMQKELYLKSEKSLFKTLNTPVKIQDFLAFEIKHNPAKDGVECRSPREVLRLGKAHCMEGALLAAAILEFHGHKPLLMDLRSTSEDLDHVVALFQQFGCWGAISKTNHAVLRYREPIYKSVRELAVSFFHEYFLDSGKKTLREYSAPVDLEFFNPSIPLNPHPRPSPRGRGETAVSPSFLKRGLGGVINWRTTERDLVELPDYLDKAKHYKILSSEQIKKVRKADPIEIQAGKLIEWKK